MNKREWVLATVSGVYASGAQIRDDVNIPLFFSKMYDSIIEVTRDPVFGDWVSTRTHPIPSTSDEIEVRHSDGRIFPGPASRFHGRSGIEGWRYSNDPR